MLGLSPETLLIRIITLIVSLTVHEFSHAWAAVSLGDDTPRLQGRLTLNPLKHLDFLGSLMLIMAGFGWAKPVQINPYALERRSSSALMWVSLAGPFSNFLLAVFAAIPVRLFYPQLIAGNGSLAILGQFAFEFIWINLALMLFNLLPIAPLDGEKIAANLLPPSFGKLLESTSRYGPMLLLLLVMLSSFTSVDVFGWILTPPLTNLFNLLIF